MTLAQEAGQSIKKGIVERMIRHLPASTVRKLGIFAHGEEKVSVHRDEPVFDGQFQPMLSTRVSDRRSTILFKKQNAQVDITTKKMSDLLNNGVG